MDEKKREALNGSDERLTDEQKKKAKECKTVGDPTVFTSEEGIEIPDELADEVAGGIGRFPHL